MIRKERAEEGVTQMETQGEAREARQRGQGGRLSTRGREKEQVKGVQRQKQVGPIQALNMSFTRCGKITDPSDFTLFICKMRS